MTLSSRLRILLVEDNPGDALLIQIMLRGIHLTETTRVETIAEALDLTQKQTFDLALVDLSLPDSLGISTITRLREERPTIPLVVLTGLDDEGQGIEAVQSGAQDYLIKGHVDPHMLQRSITYARERHLAEQLLRRSEQAYRSLIDDVFNTSTVGVLILDPQLRVVWMNEAIEIYFGVTREEMLGQDNRELVTGTIKCIFADPEDYATRLLRAYSAGDFTDRFECHIRLDGRRQERWLEHWSQPIRQGLYAGGRIEQYTDITDRKKAEFAEIEQRRFAEALRSTAEALTSTLDLDDVLDRMLETIDTVVPNDAANILFIEDDDLRIARTHGEKRLGTSELVDLKSNLRCEGVFETIRLNRQPIILKNSSNYAEIATLYTLTGTRPMSNFAGIPIILQDEVIGFINVFRNKSKAFTMQDVDRMLAFGDQAAIAIRNAHLYRRSRELATIQERQRIARELHDSVSQTLFSAQSMCEAGVRQLDVRPQQARILFNEVHELLASALAEMRILLLELRPAALAQVSLKQLFEQYLRATLAYQNIEMQLQMEEVPLFSAEVQIALYRIVQEAVNNVIKHAGATQVIVSAREEAGDLILMVKDNGRGFSGKTHSFVSLGLGIMQERAESIGATLKIESEAGKGTQVIVTWHMK